MPRGQWLPVEVRRNSSLSSRSPLSVCFLLSLSPLPLNTFLPLFSKFLLTSKDRNKTLVCSSCVPNTIQVTSYPSSYWTFKTTLGVGISILQIKKFGLRKVCWFPKLTEPITARGGNATGVVRSIWGGGEDILKVARAELWRWRETGVKRMEKKLRATQQLEARKQKNGWKSN